MIRQIDYKRFIEKKLKKNTKLKNGSKWTFFFGNSELKKSGWKIHVSCSITEYQDCFNKVIPFLIKKKINFKIPSNVSFFQKLNSGDAGNSQCGKVITLYINSQSILKGLISDLEGLWPITNGPIVINEYRNISIKEKNAISLRYGAFKTLNSVSVTQSGFPQTIIKKGGKLFVDKRDESSSKHISPISNYIFFKNNTINDILERFEILKNYKLVKTLKSKPGKSVFLAINLLEVSTYIVKIVDSKYGVNLYGNNYIQKLENEASVLTILTRYEHSPKLKHFEKNENFAISIIEDISGKHPIQANVQYEKIINAVNKLHTFGICHYDLKPDNIIVTESGKVFLIDFELSGKIGSTRKIYGATVGYFNSSTYNIIYEKRYDQYSLNSIKTSLLFKSDVHFVANTKEHISNYNKLFDQNEKRILKKGNDIKKIDFNKVFNKALNFYNNNQWNNNHIFSDYNLHGINIGSSGIILGLLSIYDNLNYINKNRLNEIVLQSANTIAESQIYDSKAGLFTGSLSRALILTIISKRYGIRKYNDVAFQLVKSHKSDFKELDFFSGVSGKLYLYKILNTIQSDYSLEKDINNLEKKIWSKKIDKILPIWSKSEVLEKNKNPQLGAAHGSAGILLALYSLQSNDKLSKKNDFDNLIKNYFSTEKKAFYKDTSKSTITLNNTWCHGLIGFFWVINQLFENSTELYPELLTELISAPELINPTVCHGLSGVLDVLNQFNKHDGIKGKIENVKTLIEMQYIEDENEAYWYSENNSLITPDLWVGFLGTASVYSNTINDKKYSIFSLCNFKQLCGEYK